MRLQILARPDRGIVLFLAFTFTHKQRGMWVERIGIPLRGCHVHTKDANSDDLRSSAGTSPWSTMEPQATR